MARITDLGIAPTPNGHSSESELEKINREIARLRATQDEGLRRVEQRLSKELEKSNQSNGDVARIEALQAANQALSDQLDVCNQRIKTLQAQVEKFNQLKALLGGDN